METLSNRICNQKDSSNPTEKDQTNPIGSPEQTTPIQIKGYDFSKGSDFENLIPFLISTGIQSTQLGKSIQILNKIISERQLTPKAPHTHPCKLILGFTSNMISCGMREYIKFLCEHKFVDALVTTTGAVEEDIMKCLNDTYIGDYVVDDREFRKKGINRIGNMMVPNENYCSFEDFLVPNILEMHKEQDTMGTRWTPSKFIKRLGQSIDHKDSVLYWCAKNDIDVFSPALTDGAVGDVLFFHSYKKGRFILDINEDYTKICDFYEGGQKKAALIFGGGTVKHHVMNAAKHHGGLDYTIVINTAENFDCSESGAVLEDQISRGKLKGDSEFVKVTGEVSIIAPIQLAETFGKRKQELLENSHF